MPTKNSTNVLTLLKEESHYLSHWLAWKGLPEDIRLDMQERKDFIDIGLKELEHPVDDAT